VSGFLTIATSDIRKSFLAHDDSLLPKKLEGVLAHEVHSALLTVMLVLIVVHLLGALKHQFVLKDNIMDRMSLRKKN
jgi:cytochrome b561